MSETPAREPGDAQTGAPVRERVDGYYRNGEWVPRGTVPDPQPPGWRERFEARFGNRWTKRRFWLAAAAGLIALIVLLVSLGGRSPARMPKEEREFLSAVRHSQQEVRDGNELTLVTAARDRAGAVCALLPHDGTVEDWVGTIHDVGTVFGGKQGHLSVSVGDDVELRTWTRTSEDAKDHTLVDPNSDVYRALADLHSGDRIRFSGAFRPQGATCLHETSVFARNGMLTPGFVFRFTSVAPR